MIAELLSLSLPPSCLKAVLPHYRDKLYAGWHDGHGGWCDRRRRGGGGFPSGTLWGLCKILPSMYRSSTVPRWRSYEESGSVFSKEPGTQRNFYNVSILSGRQLGLWLPQHRKQETPVGFYQGHGTAGDYLRQFIPSTLEEGNQDTEGDVPLLFILSLFLPLYSFLSVP